MAFQLYLQGITGSGTRQDPRKPEYWDEFPNGYGWIPYGQNNACIAGGEMSVTEHAAMLLHLDSKAYPQDLDSTVNLLNLTLVRGNHEEYDIPADWIEVGTDYRTIIRRVVGFFFIAQAMNGQGQNLLSIDLNSPISNYTTAAQEAFDDALVTLDLDNSEIESSMSLREVLGTLAPQFDDTPVTIDDEEI